MRVRRLPLEHSVCSCLTANGASQRVWTGLWKAAEKGSLKEVQDLKAAGANPNWVNPQEPPGRAHQFTPLHIASANAHLDVVKWLTEKGGVDINKKCPYGETSLEHCDGRKGLEGVQSYLKMKTAMNAVLAAQKFKAASKK